MTRLPLVDAFVRAVEILREKGSVSSSDLLEVIGSRRTAYRALEALKAAGLVAEESGMYVWYEHAAVRTYESEAEFKMHLEHSRKLNLSLNRLAGLHVNSSNETDGLTYASYAKMHLSTGYPEIYKVHKEAEEVKAKIQEREKRLLDGVKGKLSLQSEIKYPENVAKVVYEDIKSILTGHEPSFLSDFKVEGDDVNAGGYVLAKKVVADQVKEFLEEQEASTANRKLCGNILTLENEYHKLRTGLEEELTRLVLQIESGTPLRGRCDICPEIRIKPAASLKRAGMSGLETPRNMREKG
jgi:hypothetical protein